MRRACDSLRPTVANHGHGRQVGAPVLITVANDVLAASEALSPTHNVVVRGGVEPPTFRFCSRWRAAQLQGHARSYRLAAGPGAVLSVVSEGRPCHVRARTTGNSQSSAVTHGEALFAVQAGEGAGSSAVRNDLLSNRSPLATQQSPSSNARGCGLPVTISPSRHHAVGGARDMPLLSSAPIVQFALSAPSRASVLPVMRGATRDRRHCPAWLPGEMASCA